MFFFPLSVRQKHSAETLALKLRLGLLPAGYMRLVWPKKERFASLAVFQTPLHSQYDGGAVCSHPSVFTAHIFHVSSYLRELIFFGMNRNLESLNVCCCIYL